MDRAELALEELLAAADPAAELCALLDDLPEVEEHFRAAAREGAAFGHSCMDAFKDFCARMDARLAAAAADAGLAKRDVLRLARRHACGDALAAVEATSSFKEFVRLVRRELEIREAAELECKDMF